MDCRVKPGNDGRRRLTGTALQTELPDGANPFSLPRENIPLNPSGKSKVKSRPSRPTRGAYRDRHGRRVRDAVAAAMPGAQDVRRADVSVSGQRAPDEGVALAFDQDFDGAQSPAKPLGEDGLRTAKPCGPGARGWRQAAGGQQSPTGIRLTFNPAATEARGIRLRGEHGISRKTTAQGMPECSGCSCMLVCAFLAHYCTRDRGCSKHPAFPAPSDFLGKGFLQSSGETRRENAEVCLRRMGCRVGKAQRAHHLSTSVIQNGGHAALCPPYVSTAMIWIEPRYASHPNTFPSRPASIASICSAM
jgi:hypothetical protein